METFYAVLYNYTVKIIDMNKDDLANVHNSLFHISFGPLIRISWFLLCTLIKDINSPHIQ